MEEKDESTKVSEVPAETGSSEENTSASEVGQIQSPESTQQGDESGESSSGDGSSKLDDSGGEGTSESPVGAAENATASENGNAVGDGGNTNDTVSETGDSAERNQEVLNHLDGNEESYGKILVHKLIEMQTRTGKDVFRVAPKDYDALVMNRLINGVTNTVIDNPRLTVIIDSSIPYGMYLINE